jgi:CheY-like chemotaxis protein
MTQVEHRPYRVLLVEDDVAISEAFAQILEDEGYAVAAAANGQEALDYLRDGGGRPHVILLDLMMPVLNGYGFRAEQLRDPAIADIPVIVVSADRGARLAAGELQVEHVLTKPVDIGILLDTVAALCPVS